MFWVENFTAWRNGASCEYMAPPFTGGCRIQKARDALGSVGVAFFLCQVLKVCFLFLFYFFFQVEILIHLWTAWTQCISLRSEGRLSLSCRFFFCLKVQGSFDGKHQKETLQAAFLNLAEGHQQEKPQPHILLLGNLEWHCWLRKRQQRHTLKQGIKLSIEILVLVSVACFLYSELKKNLKPHVFPEVCSINCQLIELNAES